MNWIAISVTGNGLLPANALCFDGDVFTWSMYNNCNAPVSAGATVIVTQIYGIWTSTYGGSMTTTAAAAYITYSARMHYSFTASL